MSVRVARALRALSTRLVAHAVQTRARCCLEASDRESVPRFERNDSLPCSPHHHHHHHRPINLLTLKKLRKEEKEEEEGSGDCETCVRGAAGASTRRVEDDGTPKTASPHSDPSQTHMLKLCISFVDLCYPLPPCSYAIERERAGSEKGK